MTNLQLRVAVPMKCRSSLTLSAAIETKKCWDAWCLFPRDELLHIAALSANSSRCDSNGGSKVNKIFTR